MSINVEYLESLSLLKVTAEGTNSNEERCSAFAQAIEIAKHHEPQFGLLHFEEAANDIPEDVTFETIRSIENEITTVKQMKWAVVLNDDLLVIPMVLGRLFARGVWIAVFSRMSEAADWLYDDREKPIWLSKN